MRLRCAELLLCRFNLPLGKLHPVPHPGFGVLCVQLSSVRVRQHGSYAAVGGDYHPASVIFVRENVKSRGTAIRHRLRFLHLRGSGDSVFGCRFGICFRIPDEFSRRLVRRVLKLPGYQRSVFDRNRVGVFSRRAGGGGCSFRGRWYKLRRGVTQSGRNGAFS